MPQHLCLIISGLKTGNCVVGETNPTLNLDSVSANDGGNYSVKIENSLGIDSSCVVKLIIDGALRQSENSIRGTYDSLINVYPNPATNILHVEYLEDLSSPVHGSIIDISGNEVFSFSDYNSVYASNVKTVDVSSLRNGNYFLIIKNPGYKIKNQLSIIR